MADARAAAWFRGEGHRLGGRWVTAGQMVRLALESDAYLAQILYRVGASARRRRLPLLPRVARAGAAAVAQVHIGPDVVIAPGLYLAHGQVAMSGRVRLGPGVVVFPWATITASDGEVALASDVRVGTGAVIEGPATVGAGVRIGANATVTGTVPAGARIAGVPARPVTPSPSTSSADLRSASSGGSVPIGSAPERTGKVLDHGGNAP